MQKKRRPIPMQHDFSANVCGNEKDAVTLHYKTTGNWFCQCKQQIVFLREGEMPEWSNGPHSKCGIRVTVSRVRIPVSPLKQHKRQTVC